MTGQAFQALEKAEAQKKWFYPSIVGHIIYGWDGSGPDELTSMELQAQGQFLLQASQFQFQFEW